MAGENVQIDFIIAGQPMTAANAPAHAREALQRVEHNLRKALAGIKAPKDKPIRIMMSGETTDRLKFTIDADKAVIKQVQQKLKEATSG